MYDIELFAGILERHTKKWYATQSLIRGKPPCKRLHKMRNHNEWESNIKMDLLSMGVMPTSISFHHHYVDKCGIKYIVRNVLCRPNFTSFSVDTSYSDKIEIITKIGNATGWWDTTVTGDKYFKKTTIRINNVLTCGDIYIRQKKLLNEICKSLFPVDIINKFVKCVCKVEFGFYFTQKTSFLVSLECVTT